MQIVAVACLAGSLFAASIAIAQADARRAPSFSCAIGAKRVSVTKSGDHFVYHFGSAAHDQMTIDGDPAQD